MEYYRPSQKTLLRARYWVHWRDGRRGIGLFSDQRLMQHLNLRQAYELADTLAAAVKELEADQAQPPEPLEQCEPS